MPEKIIIYDNNPVTIIGLDYLLSQNNYEVVGGTTDPDELIRCILSMKPSYVIIDPSYMREDYLLKLYNVYSLDPGFQFIIFAGSERVYHILRNCRFVWKAYLSKTMPPEALLEVLQNSPEKEALNAVFQYKKGSVNGVSATHTSLDSLTGREMQVLRKMGAGKTNKMIADEMFLSNKTISTYKRNIMNKLHTNDVRDVVDIARRHGF